MSVRYLFCFLFFLGPRQLFYISGGMLLSGGHSHPRGRFEFREVLNGEFILVAISDFVPALPWRIYKNTHGHSPLIRDDRVSSPPELEPGREIK
jgi:hypothetical protein